MPDEQEIAPVEEQQVVETPVDLPADPPPIADPPSDRGADGRFAGKGPKPDDAQLQADALARLPDVFRQAFDGDMTDEELAIVATTITPETLRNAPPAVAATFRAFLKQHAAAEATRAADALKATEAFTAREAAIVQKERALAQRQRAVHAISLTAKDPGGVPQVDPLTAEGQIKLAEWAAENARFKAEGPAREEATKLARQEAWGAILDSNPHLKDPTVKAEFDAFFHKQNEGVDLKKVAPRVTVATAATMFANERELASLRAAQQAAKAAQQADRNVAMRSVGRLSTGGGDGADPIATFGRLMKDRGPEGAAEYLTANPDFHTRLKAAQARA